MMTSDTSAAQSTDSLLDNFNGDEQLKLLEQPTPVKRSNVLHMGIDEETP